MRRPTSFLLAAALTSLAAGARADDNPSPADIAAARAFGQEGMALAEAGNCADAIERFSRAEKIFHAPTTLERLGECQVNVGKLVVGTENLYRVVREFLPPSAPPAFVAAQERARKILDEAKPKIAALKIAVSAPPDAVLTVKVDGERVPVANLDANRPADPGEHVVEASAPGYRTAKASVKLAEGASSAVALTLEAEPRAVVVAEPVAPPAPTEKPPPVDDGKRSRKPIPAYVAWGVGAVGVGVGAIFGLMALGKKSDLDEACPNKVCPGGESSTIDSGKTLGTVSTIGFIVGGVGIGVGTYLFVAESNKKNTATVRPWLGVGSAGVSGRF
jgi:hypothetical protein